MATRAKPHSAEWFKVLGGFDRHQADHTRAIIKAAGSDKVCSICGDEPAADYELVVPVPAARAVSAIRLCDDCRMIREQSGESYVPFKP